MDERKQLRLGCTVLAVIVVSLLSLSFFFVIRSKAVHGKLMETHLSLGRPTVEIWMFGFLQGHSFQVLINTNGKRTQIVPEIWYMPPNFGTTNAAVTKQSDVEFCRDLVAAKGSSEGGVFYQVYWTRDGDRCALALHKHLVAAFDVRTGAQLRYTGDYYEKFNPRIRNFLLKPSLPELPPGSR